MGLTLSHPYNCRRLAEEYERVTNKPIRVDPDLLTPLPNDQNGQPPFPPPWFETENDLYTSRMHCITNSVISVAGTPTTTYPAYTLHPPERCATIPPLSLDETTIRTTNGTTNGTPSDVAPAYRALVEDGFLHWVNERSVKCINRVIGNTLPYYPPQTKTSPAMKNIPFLPYDARLAVHPAISPPLTDCSQYCSRIHPDSQACFDCVTHFLQSHPEVCNFPQPGAYVAGAISVLTSAAYLSSTAGEEIKANPTLLRECVSCQMCLGSESDPWHCLTGTFPTVWTSRAYIVLALSICFFLCLLLLIVFLWYSPLTPPSTIYARREPLTESKMTNRA
jgi:hypothetical protein